MSSLAQLLLAALVLFGQAGQLHAQPAATTSSPALSEIPSKWNLPTEFTKGEIKGEHVARCFGASWDGPKRSADITSVQAQLVTESQRLQALSDQLAPTRISIEEDRASLEHELVKLSAEDMNMAATRLELERAKAKRVTTQAEAMRLNEMVDSFNSRVKLRNIAANAIRDSQSKLSSRIQAFNVALDELNQLGSTFKKRLQAYEEKVSALRADLARFEEACVGERRLTK